MIVMDDKKREEGKRWKQDGRKIDRKEIDRDRER